MKAEELWASLLQAAIQGRLVPQDPDDEPASVLIERIQKEKQRLVKEGKLNKDKFESKIYRKDGKWFEIIGKDEKEIDVPFEIPINWVWVRGHSLFLPNISIEPSGDFFDYIDLSAIDNTLCRIREMKKIPVKGATSRARRKIKAGNVLYSTVRPYLKNIAIVGVEHEHAIASTGFFVCDTHGITTTEFLYYLLQSPYIVCGQSELVKSERSPSISNEDFLNYYYPIPPLLEQQRIVAKLEELQPLLNKYASSTNRVENNLLA